MTLAFSAPQEALHGALRAASRVSPVRGASPVLQGLLAASGDDLVLLSGYDQALGLQVTCPAVVTNAGTAWLPAAQLCELVGRLPAGSQVGLRVSDDGAQLHVDGDPGARYSLSLPWSAADWPGLPQGPTGASAEIPLALLADALARVAHCCAPEGEGKGPAEGVSLSASAKNLQLLASDGRRASLVSLPGLGGKWEAVISRSLAKEISRLPGDGESMVNLSLSDGLIRAESEGAVLVANLLSGQYPPIANAFPGNHEVLLKLKSELLIDSMSRIAVFSELAVLEINFDTSLLAISLENDSGKGLEHIPFNPISGAGILRLALNPKYVLTALKAVQQPDVTIGFNGSDGPVVIEAGFHRYLIMPIQVKDGV